MYNPYQQSNYQQGYGYPGSNGQGYPIGQQATGFYNGGQPQQQQQQPFQPGLFQGQQTGYQPQQSGYQPGNQGFQQQQQQQPQQQQFQPQQTGFQPQQTGFQQPQYLIDQQYNGNNYGIQQQQQQQQTGYSAPLLAQRTGFLAALGSVSENKDLVIPSIRLSFISAADQTKFEHLFRTAVPKGEQSITGDAARDILLRSGLQPVMLAEIWALADTNKLGSLLFPEFALALHLCNKVLKNEPLPAVLPDKWLNEVQSFVDAISFSLPDDPNKILANTPFSSFAQNTSSSNNNNSAFDWMNSAPTPSSAQAPPPVSFTAQPTGGFNQAMLSSQRTGGGTLIPLQPQQTASFVPAQPTGGLQPQTTGIRPQGTGLPSAGLQAQNTGYQQNSYQPAPSTSFQPQQTGLQAQNTGYQQQGNQPQSTGFQPQQTGLQPQNTGYQYQGLQPQNTGYLQSQPTGKPGQWGFVPMPTGGIPGLNAMQQHFLPSSQLSSNNLQNAMGGSLTSNVTWSITKQEKQIYDGIFNEWDKQRKGFIEGDVAITIFGKSGLARPDLESIWNLCDASNRGRLNKDEFAVAMHLVYRRLNGLDIPLRLPPELVPPSAKYLQESVDSLKNSLKGGSAKKAVSSDKQVSNASRFKNNDDAVGYVSSSRHKSRRTPEEKTTVPTSNQKGLTVAELKKLIHEKQILLDATDLEDQHNRIAAQQAEEKDLRQIEQLKAQIKEVQAQLTKISGGDTSSDKAQLMQRLDHYTKDKVPTLIARINSVTKEIAGAKTELVKKEIAKKYPGWKPDAADEIQGTGPNGEVTESDVRKHKSKQLLRQRMAALTGKSTTGGGNEDAQLQYKQEIEKLRIESESQTAIIKDVELSIKELEDGAAVHLQVSEKTLATSSKWDDGKDLRPEVKEFLDELKRFGTRPAVSNTQNGQKSTVPSTTSAPPVVQKTAKMTPEERSAYMKAQAEKRMNERLAKLGLGRYKNEPKAEKQPASPSAAQISSPPAVENTPIQAPGSSVTTKPDTTLQKPQPKSEPVPKQAAPQNEDSSDDDDDPEYAALLKQKAEMEARKKDRALKKQREKDERLAKLKREMEQLKDSDSEDETPNAATLYTPGSVNKPAVEPVVKEAAGPGHAANSAALDSVSPPVSQPQASVPTTNLVGSHASNPFSKPGQSGTSSSLGANTNPFFKPTVKQESVDQKKLDAQRASQRGLGNEDWSDDEVNSSEDDEPNRAGAAKLASLLFGGMPQPISRHTTGNPAAAPPVQAQAPVPEQKPATSVNAAPSVPEVPVPDSRTQDGLIAPMDATSIQASAPPVPTSVPPVPVPQAPVPTHPGDLSDSDSSNDEFATPSPPTVPFEQPPIAPATDAPPVPSSIPPPPPPSFFPTPVADVPSAPFSAPPPPPPPPPPPTGAIPPPPAAGPPSLGGGAPPNIGALLGQITGGKSLRKVDESEKQISDSATVGKVLN